VCVYTYIYIYIYMCVCVCVCVCVHNVCMYRWMDGQMDVFCDVKNSEIPPISGPLNL